MEVHVFAGSNIQSSRHIENSIVIHRVFCSGPQEFQNNVLGVFKKEHGLNPFQLAESAEIHANALAIKKAFPSLPLIVRLHASNWLVESFKKKYMPLHNKLRFVLGALRRGKWDLGYWRKYEYKNDVDYCYVQTADFITAPSIQMKKWAVEYWKINPTRIKVLENPFVDNETFKKARTNNEEHAIIFYGRLNVLKGLITATKAMALILKNNPEWRWLIVGDDGTAADGKTSMKYWMKKEFKAIDKQVEFYNSIPYDQLPELLQQASIVLVPSLFESYSYVTIEAMSAGKAIVGSSGTGVASLIKHNVSGKLVDPYQSAAWVKVIQELIDDKKLRRGIGRAAIQSVEEKTKVNNDIIAYYNSLTGQILITG